MVNKTIYIKQIGIILIALTIGFLAAKILFSKKNSVYNFTSILPGTEPFQSIDKNTNKLNIGGVLLKNKVTRFNLETIDSLESVKLHMSYKPGQKEIKLGIRTNESEPFTYKSLFFDPINDLTWERVSQDGLTLYQKTKQFETVQDFLQNLPTDKKVGVYQINNNDLVPYLYPKSEQNQAKTIIDTPFRGNAIAYILVPGGNLNIRTTKQDMNMYEGEDTLNISLTKNGVKMGEATIGDDGFADKSKSQTAAQVQNLTLNDAKPGVYRVDFRFNSMGNDSVITNIEINQSKVVLSGSILTWNGQPATFFTASNKINASTMWLDAIQNLKVDDKADLTIKEVQTKFGFDLEKTIGNKPAGELYKITAPKGNINFEATYFSLSPESYFDPNIIKAQVLTANINKIEMEKDFDFILTSWTPKPKEDYWQVSDLDLNIDQFKSDSKKIFFSLEVPDLDRQGGSLEIRELTVSLVSK